MSPSDPRTLAVFETHPIQYHAPVYQALQERFGVPVTVIYGSDFSVAGALDHEFGTSFAWDTDLLSGYTPVFLARGPSASNRIERISARGAGKVLQGINPEAVLLNGYGLPFHRRAFLCARRSGHPIFLRGETTDHAVRRGTAKAFVRDEVLRWFYRQFSKLLYIGQRSRDHFERLGCAHKKLIFSPYCVDARPFRCSEAERAGLRAAARLRLGVSESQTVLLFAGKLSRRKAPDLLLRALEHLPAEVRRKTVTVFLGDGELRSSLAAEASHRPELDVRFAGFQNQTQLSPYYHAADLLVLPSLHSETWGLVVNEALHHGLPCVVSDAVGSAPDLVEPGSTGEICEAGSAHSLASALRRGLALAGRGEIRKACRAKAEAYSVVKAAEGIATAYWEVAHESARAVAHSW